MPRSACRSAAAGPAPCSACSAAPLRGDGRLVHELAYRFLDRLVLVLVVVLRRHDDRLDPDRSAVLVADRGLGLAVGAEPVGAAELLLADLGEPRGELVRDLD